MLVHRRVTPRIKFSGTLLHTLVERGTVRVKCLAQERNTMFPKRGERLENIFSNYSKISDKLHIYCMCTTQTTSPILISFYRQASFFNTDSTPKAQEHSVGLSGGRGDKSRPSSKLDCRALCERADLSCPVCICQCVWTSVHDQLGGVCRLD